MKSLDIRLTDKEKRNQVLLCLDYTGLKINAQGGFLALPLGELSPKVTERALALPLGELSPQVTERALSVLAVLGHLSQRERQGFMSQIPFQSNIYVIISVLYLIISFTLSFNVSGSRDESHISIQCGVSLVRLFISFSATLREMPQESANL